MLVEVHTAGRTAVPGRALLISIALLSLACALAVGMTWLRSAEPIGRRCDSLGWEISFRTPRRFRAYAPTAWRHLEFRQFVGATRQGAEAVLILWRIGHIHEDEDIRAVARDVLLLCDLREPVTAWFEEPFGPVQGVEIQTPGPTTIVRAAIVNPSVAFAVSLDVRGGWIDEDLYRLFDLTCRSIELVDH